MFKRGNFIIVKPNTRLESGEIVNGWAGEVQEVYTQEKTCLVTFDTQTIQSLSDSFLEDGLDIGAEPFEYVFNFKDLELAERRDTDRQLEKALDALVSRMIDLEASQGDRNDQLKEQWIKEFLESDYFNAQDKIQQEHSNFVISLFMEFMYNYEGVMPKGWTPEHVEKVCLYTVPRKVVADDETFALFGDVLVQFLKFLGDQNYITNADALATRVEKIKGKILAHSKDPSLHGMTKSLLNGQSENLFLDEDGELDMKALIAAFESSPQNKKVEQAKVRPQPLRENPFKGIGRNEKITVKYEDGRIVENIKFKKVEMDLRNGDCILIK